MMKLKKIFANLALSLISFYITLVAVEYVLGFFFFLPNSLASYYPLEVAKLGKKIHIQQFEFDTFHNYNEQGFREKNIEFEKPLNSKRILFVGDSFTEGFGVDEEARFSNLLINKLGPRFQGINIGQLATNPDNYFDNIIKFGLALKPDIVVFGLFFGNDFQGGKSLPTPDPNKYLNSEPNNFNSGYHIFTLPLLKSLILQIKNKKIILVRKRDIESKNFWELYYGQKITKKFRLQSFKLTEQELDNVTKKFNQNVLNQYYSGYLNSNFISEAINNQLGIPEQTNFYNREDFENTYEYIKAAHKVCFFNKVKFIVLIIPEINQVNGKTLAEVLKNDFLITKTPSRFLQLDSFYQQLLKKLDTDKINYADPTNDLKLLNLDSYYHYDNHMNKFGHKVLSNILYDKIITYYPEFAN